VSLLEKNLEALGGRFPELASLVAAAPELALELRVAGSGEPSARIPGGGWLHSSRDPREEARRLAAASLARGVDTAVLFGLGLGYLAEALLDEAGPGLERVIACEAGLGSLKAAFGARDLSALLADQRLGFVVGCEPESLITALELSGGARAAILELKAAVAAEPAWFERARRAAERWNAKGRVNEQTLRRFGRLWVRNLARNLGEAAETPGIERLESLFSGLPAIVLAAGPSLDLVLPRIKELSRRALVVCVDTALRSLLRCGIEPDFLVVVDPQYWNWRHLAGLSSPSSLLVSEMTTWPAVFRAHRRGTFLGGSLFPLGRRIEAFTGEKGRLGAGGSVATSAWDLCRLMGCSPVWMAGLDLSYPGGQTHARASLFEQRALAAGRRLEPASSAQAAALVGGPSFEGLSAEGGRVRSDQRMTLYAWWFESRLARPGSPLTLSLSPGGLGIPGLSLGSLEELLACPDIRGELGERLARAASLHPPPAACEGANRGLASLLEELSSIAGKAEAAEAAAAEGEQVFARGGDCHPFLETLEAADLELLGLEGREIAAFLLPPLADILGSGALDLGEGFERSKVLYGKLAESARYHLEVLEAANKLRGTH
jgi:hypothetical protein